MSVEVAVFLHHATDEAYLVSDDGDEDRSVWLPKSQVSVKYDPDPTPGDNYTMLVPEWLAEDRGLI